MVAAQETTLQKLLQGAWQYQVPLYQRTYSWGSGQLARLWDDLVKVAEDRTDQPEANHFIGSLVLAPSPTNGPGGVQQYLVIDGQQRLTTLSLLLCAIRDHRAETEDPEHRERIDQMYLVNKWEKPNLRAKMVPTQADRDSYNACLHSTPAAGGQDPVGNAYRFFRARMVAAGDEYSDLNAEQIEGAVTSGLALVSVTAQAGDNAHRIFESLNNTGLRLTQADLLRNYVFMRMPKNGEQVYESLWKPLQDALTPAEIEQLFWLDLVRKDSRVKQTDTYAGQQLRLDRLSEDEMEVEVGRWARLGGLLRTILDPSLEADPGVQLRLRRINQWGTSTTRPLALHLLDLRDEGVVTSETVARALHFVESFLIRRLLIGRATAGINRILLSIVTEMNRDLPVDQAVHEYLSTGRKHYASDQELRENLAAVPFYLHGRAHQRSLVLRWIEESYGSKEPVDTTSLTIEHVLPQTKTGEWLAEIARSVNEEEDPAQTYQALVHTIGNLTLTGYNSKLSNAPFATKRELLTTSGLSMNQEIASHQHWGRTEITARSLAIASIVESVWPGPTTSLTPSEDEDASRWTLMNEALARIPAGRWTTYGDLAALIGSFPLAVGGRLGSVKAPNPHRVLRSNRKVAPDFTWLDPMKSDSPRALLEAEGVTFDGNGRASKEQRIDTEGLAALVADVLPPETAETS